MKRFRSKVDLWIVVVLVFAMLVQAYAFFSVFFQDGPNSAKYMMLGATVLLYGFIFSILARTHYTVDGDDLRIACGPLTRTIRINDISEVSETRSPLSSPALSMDRLRIRYGKRRSVMISPDDKKAFLAALGKQLS